MSNSRILILHPEPSIVALMGSMLQTLGHRIEEATHDRAAVRVLEQLGPFQLILAGIEPSDPDALEFLEYARRKYPKTPIVLLFPGPHPERAREALQRGACSVLRFPMPATQLRATVAQCMGPAQESPPASPPSQATAATNGRHLPVEPVPASRPVELVPALVSAPPNGTHSSDRESPAEPPVFVGEDPGVRQAIELVPTIAPSRAAVLILGERGTGKSMLARALHGESRLTGPFLELSCGNAKEASLEVELFGRKGGFGEGPHDLPGKIAQARGGTLFLDDLGTLTPGLQFKLLRVLQDGSYEPVGSAQTIKAEVRFILGARQDLGPLVEQGSFRQDLFYRVSVVTLKLPPLRLRGEDIGRLAEHFRARFAREQGKPVVGFTDEALELLRRHDWPGNVHELSNAVERGVVLCRDDRIEAAHLALVPREARVTRPGTPPSRPHLTAAIRPLKEALEEPERQIILQALEALNWNRQETARILDINRTTLYKKMKKYGLLFDEPAWVN